MKVKANMKMTVILFINYFCIGFAINPIDLVGGADLLKQHLVKDLGMKHEPNMKHANLSISEYTRMIEIYEKTVRQAEEIKKLRGQFKTIQHSTPSKHVIKCSEMRYKLGDLPLLQQKAVLKFPIRQAMPDFGLTLVSSARLVINIKRTNSFAGITRQVSVTQLQDEEDGVTIETVSLDNDDIATIEFDVTDAVQSWIENPENNNGLMVTGDGFLIDNDGEKEPKIIIETKFALIRHKRSLLEDFNKKEGESAGRTDCSKKENKCCRDDMKVNLRELEGFSFIIEPKQFNAYQCRGKCPPRYRPLNDHSLLQSLMHIKQQKNAVENNLRSKVKKPCCVPSKLESLPILHLDENNPSKLKVTTWKSIIVTECACG